MTTLYHPAAPVKRTRPFGRGILRSLPTDRAPYTAADLEWAAQAFNAGADADMDRRAAEAEAQDAYERGYIFG